MTPICCRMAVASVFAAALVWSGALAKTYWGEEAEVLYSPITGGVKIVAAELDGEWGVDILVAAHNASQHVIVLGSLPDQNYSFVVVDNNFATVQDIGVADLDGDDDLDLVACGEQKLRWYENQGSWDFLLHNISVDEGGARSLDIADVDGDGDSDIVNANMFTSTIRVWINDGGGSFTPQLVTDACLGAYRVALGDMDGDGSTDAAVVASATDEVIRCLQTGDLEFTASVVTDEVEGMSDIDVGDWDGDGDMDIGVASETEDKVLLCENIDNTDYELRWLVEGFTSANSAIFLDVDEDGDDDLFASAEFKHYALQFQYDRAGQFLEQSVVSEQIGLYSVTVGNVDAAGPPDVIALTHDGTDETQILWWPGRRNWNWGKHPVDNNARGATEVAVADFDLDGDLDVVGTAKTSNRVYLYENDGSDVFTRNVLVEYLPGAHSVCRDDVNGDGLADVIVTGIDNASVNLLTNQGNLVFTFDEIDGSLVQSKSVCTADVDGDGDSDIVASSRVSSIVAWYENVDGVEFARHDLPGVVPGASSAIGVDLDLDGDTDIAGTAFAADRVAWWENDGAETFTLHEIADGIGGAIGVDAGDLNQDGNLDLAVTAKTDSTVTALINDGSMSFSSFELATDFAGALDVLIDDLDNNGYLDILASAFEGNKISWWPSAQWGVGAERVIDGYLGQVRGLALADFTADGYPDIAAAANLESQVVWYESDMGDAEPLILLEVEPETDPLIIPPDGGTFQAMITVANHFRPVFVDAWTQVRHLATGNAVTTFQIEDVRIPWNISEYVLNQTVPAIAPAGEYEYALYLGDYPWNVTAYDSFSFSKAGIVANGGVAAFADPSLWPVDSELLAGISERPVEVADAEGGRYAVTAPYPNPFNPTTALTVSLPAAEQLSIVVYNIVGRRVAELANGRHPAGLHEFIIDGTNWASGLYFVCATVGSSTHTNKIVLVR